LLEASAMKRVTMATSVLILATLSTLAHAESADGENTALDPDRAFQLSAIGAAAPAAVAGVGALMVLASGGSGASRDTGLDVVLVGQLVGLVTPSIGEFYGRQIVTGGMAMRVGGLIVETVGLFDYYNTGSGDCATLGSACHHPAGTYAMIVGGAALYAGGMLYDVIRARDVASSWNRRHDVMVVPTALRTQGSVTPGVALALTF
jgi:hypothetical protein